MTQVQPAVPPFLHLLRRAGRQTTAHPGGLPAFPPVGAGTLGIGPRLSCAAGIGRGEPDLIA